MDHQYDSHLAYQCRAAKTLDAVCDRFRPSLPQLRRRQSPPSNLAETTLERRLQSQGGIDGSPETFLYLAYGSNLCNETFRGNRGIKPLSQINVQIPELRLTFDLPGIAYAEPCFANTARRDPKEDVPKDLSEKPCSLDGGVQKRDYHKDRWHKGLIGVVYEVTPSDYAHIIATEGGGSAYQDILVDCYPFASSDPKETVPQFPTTQPFKAHTLFAPATETSKQSLMNGGRFQRPDTSYAQASARYLKLITDGAAECRLPYEYQDFLNGIRPYTITSNKQRLGQFVFLTLWLPLIMLIFGLSRNFSDDGGRAPEWLKILSGAIFQASWASYDTYFKELFGEGERTVPKSDEDDADSLLLDKKPTWFARHGSRAEKGYSLV